MTIKVDHEKYASLFGPTTGDSVRLGDTNLYARVEKDLTVHGNESIFAGGKVLRDGMGMNNTILREDDPMVADMVISDILIIDYTGVYKADIGIRDGKILAIGKGGNPNIMDDVDFIIGASTEALNGEGMIVTAGGIDTHVHYIEPSIVQAALDNGITTLIGGGTGPANGTRSATCSPGKVNISRTMQGFDDLPISTIVMAKGAGANPEVIGEQIKAGAGGIKLHEDWGATASGIDNSLTAADKYFSTGCPY